MVTIQILHSNRLKIIPYYVINFASSAPAQSMVGSGVADPGIGTKRVYNGHSMHGTLLDNPYLLVTDTASKKWP